LCFAIADLSELRIKEFFGEYASAQMLMEHRSPNTEAMLAAFVVGVAGPLPI
jgi:hypothetical protein